MKTNLIPFLLTAITLIVPSLLVGSDLKVSKPVLKVENGSYVCKVNISWLNAWRSEKNYDAVWIFLKMERQGADIKHLKIKSANIQQSELQLTAKLSDDNLGVMIYLSDTYKGNVEASVSFTIDESSFGRNSPDSSDPLHAFGIEMVYIPEGPFTMGEPGDAVLDFGGLYLSDAEGKPKGLWEVTSGEQEIKVGPGEDQLYYQAKTGYEGDQKGTIPSSFPNGYNSFFIMKYEPTQRQYAAFLNTLTEQQSHHRANFGGKTYYARRGSIRVDNDIYIADQPERPCNFMSWDDAMAYADWAGLRPMTEMEFVKAARGPGTPITNEFPWNTDTYQHMLRQMGEDGNVDMTNGWDESKLDESNREAFGASYYWVMDLAGSMWERVISIGHEIGRNFDGKHGNGDLDGYGFADVEGWPSGVDGEGGFGFRGGGYYVYPMNFTEFNPYSPIAYRRYGGWAGGNRKEAYGTRFVRTAF